MAKWNPIIFYGIVLTSCLVQGSGEDSAGSYKEICLDCLENNVISKCNLPLCQSNTSCSRKIDLNRYAEENVRPTLICRDESSLTFAWSSTEDNLYLLECEDVKFIQMTRCDHLTITHLKPSEEFTFNLYRISPREGIVYKNREFKAKTVASASKKSPVNNLTYVISLRENSYSATVHWEPGEDKTCLYEIVWYGKHDPGEYIHRRINLKMQLKPQFNLTDLEFGRTYHFSIMSIGRTGASESAKKYLKILVPSCLDALHNLTICPPSKPKNLSANVEYVNQTRTDLELTWSGPEYRPDFYTVDFLSFNRKTNGSFSANVNVSGAETSTVMKNVSIGTYYMVKLVAYSKGGGSTPAYLRIDLEKDNTDSAVPQSTSSTFNSLVWICALSLLLFLMALWFYRRIIRDSILKFLFPKQKLDNMVVKYTVSEAEDSKWELAESKLFIDKVIGFGAFGIVQKGYYYLEPNKKTEVAIKTLKAKPSDDQIAQFYDEIEIMKSVPRHAHIVYLIGVVTRQRQNNPLMLVEFCSRGNLQSFLRKMAFVLTESSKMSEPCSMDYPEPDDGTKFSNKSYDFDQPMLESRDLMSFARQIVLGMEFLSNLKVIHRDLAARNVLIAGDNTLKISDFGLSRDIYTDNMYKKVTGGKLPFRWMALESLTHQIYTTESDVWSFGIVLWEIVTLGGNPYPTINTEVLVPLLRSGYRMDRPANCSEELYGIMLNCWETSPNMRPSFSDLRETFDKLLESEMQYISLTDVRKIEPSRYENVAQEQGARYAVHDPSSAF